VCALNREDFVHTRSIDNPPLLPEVYIEILLDRTWELSSDKFMRRATAEIQG
jgi:hypothetical protein